MAGKEETLRAARMRKVMKNQMRWVAALAVAGVVGFSGYIGGEAEAKDKSEKIEIKGPVKNMKGQCPNVEFEVAGAKVKTSSRTDFDGDCRSITDGKRVEVEGKLRGDQIEAKEVDVD